MCGLKKAHTLLLATVKLNRASQLSLHFAWVKAISLLPLLLACTKLSGFKRPAPLSSLTNPEEAEQGRPQANQHHKLHSLMKLVQKINFSSVLKEKNWSNSPEKNPATLQSTKCKYLYICASVCKSGVETGA